MDETERLDDAEKQRFRELLREQQAFRLQAKNVRWRNPDIDREEMLRRQQQEGFGTELDKVNCAFFLKTGACRYGETCSKQHPYPSSSNTLLFTNMYYGPGLKELGDDFALELTEKDVYDAFHKFWDDVVPEFERYGEIEALRVCRNHSQHLRGNVLVKYRRLEDAERAKAALNGRSYDGRRLMVQFVAVENFGAAICGMFNRNECDRGRECNFLHVFRNPGHKYEERDDDNRRSRDRSPPRRPLDDREGRNYRDDRRRDSRYDDHHRRDEPRRDDQRRDDYHRREESRRDESRRDESRRDDRRDEPRRDDRDRREDRRDERRDESRRDDRSHDDRRDSRRDDRDRDRDRERDRDRHREGRDRHRDHDDRDRHRDHDARDKDRDRKRGRSPSREEHEADPKKPRVDAD